MTLLHSLIPRQQSNYTFEYFLRFSSCTFISFCQCIQQRSDIMAVRTQEKPHKAEDEGDVSHCVHNLIDAFTNGLNIFKRLRERRRKHKARKEIQAPEPINSAELQLSNSLRRGPQDLSERYEECYGQKGMGSRFAKGDCKYSCRCRILPSVLIESSHRSCVSCRNPDEAQHRPCQHHHRFFAS
jgi:hypothetical protein